MSLGGLNIRRSRAVLLGAVVAVLVFIFYVPWELPASVKEHGLSALSRANVVQLTKGKVKDVEVTEIFGLLHLVTSTQDNGDILNGETGLDVSKPLDWDLYAAGEPDLNWSKEVARLNKVHPIIVFSKTYCPYSRRAKKLLETYDISPPPKIVEVDTREDGHFIKALLGRLTNHSTFPNVIIQGKSIGGSDNLQELYANGELRRLIASTGAKITRKTTAPMHLKL